LTDNFRSREALLHFVNSVFAALMRSEIGGVAYDADVHLRFGSPDLRKHLSLAAIAAAQSVSSEPRVELHLLDESNTDEEFPSDATEEQAQAQTALLDLLSIERQARLAAMRLRELRQQEHHIW